MLDIIDKLNGEGIQDNDLLVSFDIINMFPSIDNESGIKIVRNKLCQSAHNFDVPVECIIEALEICLRRNCSTFRGQYWLQENGTAMGPKNSCSYADIVEENIDVQVLAACNVYPELRCWYLFRDDTFVLWRGTVERLQAFFHLLNTFDSCLQFTMDIGGRDLHFLDLEITLLDNKLETSIYSKPTDAHIYLNANSSHPRSQIRGIAKGVALRLRRICSQDRDFQEKSKLYSKFLIDCGHDSNHVYNAFKEVESMTREQARKSKPKKKGNKCMFVTRYNPRAPDIASIFCKHRAIIGTDKRANEILPPGALGVAYSRSANLKELLAPSNPYRATRSTGNGCSKCLKRCDCCNHFLISAESFSPTITGRLYYIRKTLNRSSPNVVYLAQCVTCGLQGVGSTVNFKSRLVNYKSHIKRRRRMCGVVNE